MTIKAIISPGKYIQGAGALKDLAHYTSSFGSKPFIIADKFVRSITEDIIKQSFEQAQLPYEMADFKGECSKVEISRLKEISENKACDCVIGIGGGKTLDTAKAVAFYNHVPVIIAPTLASTDAPCSALAVIYTEEGEFDEYLPLPQNPALVLVDTQIIASAPPRLLVAGMGDALATYFEARACRRSNGTTMAGGNTTEAAFALAELCYHTLLSEGLKAKFAVEQQVTTPALEKIIEANTYLSGIGFESGGLAAAHAIHNGFTVLNECHHLYHGEKVAFGTIAQLVLENAPEEEIDEVIDFCLRVGLPVTLKDMGIKKVKPEDIYRVAEMASVEGETIHNMPFEVTAKDVYAAIMVADRLGQLYK